ncbi:class I SAM-dependent methyltransferase [Nocardia sp. alder85J]|uniref:class I SAM-dependent methyltransferase n=1 Tax=Nocardia sp. alder85J TaxID=2862949 RepID=UPI001CD5DC31|nr:class I SAM-dependent methyltransferase [Nocardia sp. alder85J]MCX4096404.1 class I SAM-dependent methyltransferase [Nocardia sp. alder85J]
MGWIGLPRALQWDHNAHYHGVLLRAVPARFERALDIGCGSGVFARKLSDRADLVDAIDRSPVMIEHARAESSSVRWILGDVLDPSADLTAGGYDVVTAISSLHHMPLRPALTRMAELLRPGGTLAVLGIPRIDGWAERGIDVFALPANAAVGILLAFRGTLRKHGSADMPIMDPSTTMADIRAAATELLPGLTVRRHLYWRYSLLWRKPQRSAPESC